MSNNRKQVRACGLNKHTTITSCSGLMVTVAVTVEQAEINTETFLTAFNYDGVQDISSVSEHQFT